MGWVSSLTLATGVYLYLLATDTVDGLRGNSQWHIPYVAHPSNDRWWLPLIPGACLAGLPLLGWDAWLIVLAAACLAVIFGYTLFAAQWGGGDNLLAKILRGPTGFWESAASIKDLRAVLANFAAYLKTVEPSSHVASHPPGDILLFRGVNDLMQAHEGLRWVVLVVGQRFVSGLPMLLKAGNKPYLMAGAIAAIPLIVTLGRLAVLPLAALAREFETDVLAAGLFFLVLPTTLVYLPLLDTAFPLLTCGIALAGYFATERSSWLLAIVTGALLGFSLFFTLGVVVIVIPLAVYALLRRGWRAFALALPMAGGWMASWLLLWLAAGINMPAIVQQLNEHQKQWEARYTYWLWFRWKWYDFVMFGGIPVAALSVKFLGESIQRWRAGAAKKLDCFFAGWLIMMIFLWVSPSAQAEVGRLWAPLMCFAALFAASALPRSRWALASMLALQLAQSIVINRYLEVVNSG